MERVIAERQLRKECVEFLLPIDPRLLRQQLLSPLEVAEAHETVVASNVLDPHAIHLPSQPHLRLTESLVVEMEKYLTRPEVRRSPGRQGLLI
ncbi:MAG: hypothetical protein HZA46_19620 [Planctomycetales bacterium]|nr:hypothetical protein [Planctomycetales bacterium]